MLRSFFNFREPNEEIKIFLTKWKFTQNVNVKIINTEIFVLNLLFIHHVLIKFCTKIGIYFPDYCFDYNIFIICNIKYLVALKHMNLKTFQY